MDLLSDFDIAVLRAAWRVLTDLERAGPTLTSAADDKYDAADVGRMEEAAKVATGTLYNALVVFATRIGDTRADRATDEAAPPSVSESRRELRDAIHGDTVIRHARALLELAGEQHSDDRLELAGAHHALASCGVELAQLLVALDRRAPA